MEKEFRCKNCNKLLAKGDIRLLSIVCPRCKVYNLFKEYSIKIYPKYIVEREVKEKKGDIT